MEFPEYLMLRTSTDPDRNIEVSVAFKMDEESGLKPKIGPREIDCKGLLKILKPEPFLMAFDECPYWVTGISIDLSKRKARITATRALWLP